MANILGDLNDPIGEYRLIHFSVHIFILHLILGLFVTCFVCHKAHVCHMSHACPGYIRCVLIMTLNSSGANKETIL